MPLVHGTSSEARSENISGRLSRERPETGSAMAHPSSAARKGRRRKIVHRTRRRSSRPGRLAVEAREMNRKTCLAPTRDRCNQGQY